MKNKVLISLGTNIGDKKNNLEEAILLIHSEIGNVTKQSSVYQTKPWGKTNQDDFYNQVIEIESELEPEKILFKCLTIENIIGRIRKEKWGERIIDLDILYVGNHIIDTEILKLPHPLMQNRNFVMIPLAEIDKEFLHPIFKKTNLELLEACPDDLEVIKI